MPQVIIFDFDGTIADTLESIVKIYNKIAPKHGLEKVKTSEKENLRNLGARELIQKFKIPVWKLPFLIQEIRLKIKKDIQNIPPLEGIPKLFKDLKLRNIKVGIVTSSSVENVRLFLERWKITNIDFIYSENSLFGKGKVLSHLIQQEGINRKETIYVGDEVRDIKAARDAEIPIIAVAWGFNSEDRLNQSKPDYLVSKPKEILDILK